MCVWNFLVKSSKYELIYAIISEWGVVFNIYAVNHSSFRCVLIINQNVRELFWSFKKLGSSLTTEENSSSTNGTSEMDVERAKVSEDTPVTPSSDTIIGKTKSNYALYSILSVILLLLPE